MSETIDERFEPVIHAAREQVASGLRPSIQLCVNWRGQTVLNTAVGDASTDSNYVLWSTTKPIVALALLSLLEERGIDVDTRVSKFLPEFGCNGKETATLAHVLSHRGGFPDSDPAVRAEFAPHMRHWDAAVAWICDMPARWAPGKERGYHPGTGWYVVGELIRRIADAELADVIDSRVLRPAGVEPEQFSLGRPHRLVQPPLPVSVASGPGVTGRGAPTAAEAANWNDPETHAAVLPGAGGISSAEPLVRIFRTLLDGGRGPGGELLTPDTIRLATFPHAVGNVDRTFLLDIPWGLGFALKHVVPSLDDCGITATPGTFGHGGHLLVNTVWADPGKDLAVCLLSNGLGPARAGIAAVRALSQSVHDVVDTAQAF